MLLRPTSMLLTSHIRPQHNGVPCWELLKAAWA